MKKKYSIIVLTCCILLIVGICYSCSFKRNNSSTELVTSLQETSLQDQEKQNSNNNSNKTATQQSNKNTDKNYSSDNDIGNLSSTSQNDKSVKSQEQEKKTWIYVHICGAVKKPGVYRAEEGTRLFTFIDMAGGFTPKADNHYVNQAQIVSDGQKIYIPTKAEVKDFVLTGDIAADSSNQGKSLNVEQGNWLESGQSNSQSIEQGNTKKNGLVNINKASSEELMELPGIGQAKADKIIEYRKTKGGFNKIEDIMNITGIKEGLFSKISPYISVNN